MAKTTPRNQFRRFTGVDSREHASRNICPRSFCASRWRTRVFSISTYAIGGREGVRYTYRVNFALVSRVHNTLRGTPTEETRGFLFLRTILRETRLIKLFVPVVSFANYNSPSLFLQRLTDISRYFECFSNETLKLQYDRSSRKTKFSREKPAQLYLQ